MRPTGTSPARLKPRHNLPMYLLVLLALAASAQTLTWHDLAKLPLEGKGWTSTAHPYDRLPAKAEGVVRPPVWNLSRESAGMRYRFVTDATRIDARWKLRNTEKLAMPNMPATGVSGLDLYVRDAGEWHWLAVGRPTKSGPAQEGTLAAGLPQRKREYMLYLPLRNSLDTVELGLPVGASIQPAPDSGRKPIVFYGTSIVHGGAASRPGMGHPAIIGRMLDWPFINLGFGGNGKSEPEMARLLAELDPAVFVLDSLPNLTATEVSERVGPFIEIVREKHPATPIVLVENVNYTSSGYLESTRTRVANSNAALRRIYDARIKAGDRNLHYVPSWQLLGGDGEDTVDGTHPSDLGFQRMAKGIGSVLRGVLKVAEDEDFVPLFDGTTLSGWKMHDGLPKVHQGGKWWIEDGVLNGTQDPPGKGGFLWLDRPYENYILKLQAKLDYPVDSGVFLRVGPDGKSHQVTLDYRPKSDIGAIYIPFGVGYVKRNQEGVRALRKDDWNDLTIRIEGQPARIRFWLNGYLLTDFQHTEETAKGLPAKGGIALQVHPDVGNLTLWKDGNRVRFRNVKIKELR